MENARIMIVEDELLVAKDLKATLEGLDYSVVANASSGGEALALTAELLPDLVLMDINLGSDCDGVTTAAQIGDNFNIPIIFLTGYSDADTLERVKISEPYGFIVKPYRESELNAVIKMSVHRHQNDIARMQKWVNSSAGSAPVSLVPSHRETESSLLECLKNLELFSSLEKNDLGLLVKNSSIVELKTSEFLFSEAEQEPPPFLLINGRLLITKSSAREKEVILEVISSGEPFGLLSAVDGLPASFAARAHAPSVVMLPSRIVLRRMLNSYPEVSQLIMKELSIHLRNSYESMRSVAHDQVKARIASALLKLMSHFPRKNEECIYRTIELSREELGNLVGTTIETTTRTIREFEKGGLVDTSRNRQITILDPKRLREIVYF